jgi:hypothetical protein
MQLFGFMSNRSLPDPWVSTVGPVAVWWIPKPRGPRTSLRSAGIAWLIVLPMTVATLWWLNATSRPLWPFGRPISGFAEILLRYELTFLACLIYVTCCSLPVWWSHRRLAKRDARAIEAAIHEHRYEFAALLLHRYCLLVSAIWRRVPAQVTAWDTVLRERLSRHRRLYVYYREGQPAPSLPPDPDAGFAPAIVPPPQPSAWWILGLLPLAFLLYALLVDIARHGRLERVVVVNVVLLAFILVTYGGYFLLALLGRSHHFRFGPGVMELVKFALGRRRPAIETFDLRGMNVALDLSSRWCGMTLLNTPTHARETFRMPRTADAVEGIFRAVLSAAPRPPLSDDQLVE